MKKNKLLYILLTILFATSIIFLCLFISFAFESSSYKNQLENNYKKNFYEVVSNINDIEIDVSKVVATTDVMTQKELLTGIYNTTNIAVNNLNLLPLDFTKVSKLNNFLNKTGGYSYSLLLSLNNGKTLNIEDYKQVTNIHTTLKEIQYDLNGYVNKIRYDYDILDDVNFKDYENNDFSGGLINTESSSSKIPTLIYDGPFSDSVLNKEIVGLNNIEYLKEQIDSQLKKIFKNQNIEYVNDSDGKFKTYNYYIYNDDLVRYVSVSKLGGMILNITGFSKNSNNQTTEVDGVKIASDFAKELGFENMFAVWTQKVGGILYVNLAPIVNHVIYYSDLIKVKVDLNLGEVIGWEATNYATNHKSREYSFKISFDTAQEKISPALTIEERNYAIVPDKYVGEVMTYEFICSWENYTYYIYIDCNTGKEVNILRVIDTNNGELLV